MSEVAAELRAWELVRRDLNRAVAGIRDRATLRFVAPIHHRLAVIRLRSAVLDELDGYRDVRGEAVPADVLLDRLADQLGGVDAGAGVLEALSPSVRSLAMTSLRRALSCDPEFAPALRAAAALTQVAGRWVEAVAWLKKLVELDGSADSRTQIMLRLGDIHWQKMGAGADARGYYQAARAELGDDVDLLDKLLKLDLELENWEPAVDTCRLLVERVRSIPERAGMVVTYLLTLGEIHVIGLRAHRTALLHYLSALDAMPGYALTYTLLRELLESSDWRDLESTLDGLPRGAGTLRPRAGHLRAAMAEHPADPAGTVEALRQKVKSPG